MTTIRRFNKFLTIFFAFLIGVTLWLHLGSPSKREAEKLNTYILEAYRYSSINTDVKKLFNVDTAIMISHKVEHPSVLKKDYFKLVSNSSCKAHLNPIPSSASLKHQFYCSAVIHSEQNTYIIKSQLDMIDHKSWVLQSLSVELL